jgi:DNA-binding NarL/FixJ family response regulator
VLEKLFATERIEVLGEQELAILRLAAQGLANSAVAKTQGVSEKRVRIIMSNICQKLNVGERGGIKLRIAAFNKAREMGLISNELSHSHR